MAAEYAYDFRSQTAPVYAPQRKPKVDPQSRPDLHKVRRNRKNAKEQEKAANVAVIKFFSAVVFCVIALSVICSSFSAVRSARAEEKMYRDQLKIYQSKQVEVEAQLGMLVTPDKIAKIAAGRLGMIKLPDENKIYGSSNIENEIIISSGEESETKNESD